MWKSRREDEKPPNPPKPEPSAPAVSVPFPNPARTMETPKMDNNRADVANIGKSVVIRGELSGSEDLYLDGEVEGNIDLHDHNLVIGPNGRVRANVQAKDVVIHGKVDGNVTGADKVELKKSALLNGDINTQRIVIEDGAFFKGAIDIRKADSSARPAAQAASAANTSAVVVPSPSSAEKK